MTNLAYILKKLIHLRSYISEFICPQLGEFAKDLLPEGLS